MPTVDEVTKCHDEYTAYLAEVTSLKDAYYGTGGYKTGTYLTKYPKEDDTKFTSRKAQVYYPNFPGVITDTYNGHIFKKPAERKTEDKGLNDFYERTNIAGDITMHELMSEAHILSFSMGWCYAVVDKPQGEGVKSKLDEINQGIRPYAYLLTPLDIIDWAVDDYGNWLWLKIKESYTKNKEDPFATHTVKYQYRVWTREDWTVYRITDNNKTAFIHEQGTHDLGEVPVVPIYFKRNPDSTVQGISAIQEIAKMTRRLFNLLSELDDLMRQQVFSILTIQGNISKDDVAALGTSSILKYPIDAVKPEFIAPPSSTTESYETRIENLLSMIMQMARLVYHGVAKTVDTSTSGVALKMKHERTESYAKKIVGKLEDSETRIARLVGLWNGNDNVEATVKYSDKFGLQDIQEDLNTWLTALALNVQSKLYEKRIQENIVARVLPELSVEDMQIIKDQINEAPDESINMTDDALAGGEVNV
jgi:hypothetical protein